MKRLYKILLWIIGALTFVSAIGFLIYGIWSHTETIFEDDLKWRSIDVPIYVGCMDYSDDVNQCSIVNNTIDLVNSRLGDTLFIYSNIKSKIDIVMGVPQNIGIEDSKSGRDSENNIFYRGENTKVVHNGTDIDSCEILVSNCGDINTCSVLIYHGLGHCLRLGHDDEDYRSSVMREHQPEDNDKIPSFTDSDVEGIRSRYLVH